MSNDKWEPCGPCGGLGRMMRMNDRALVTCGYCDGAMKVGQPRRWADQYDFDKSDPATRLFVAASNWMDRAEQAERVIGLTRTILAGDDAGSLPNDFPVDGMAAERMKDFLNTRRELELAEGKLTYLRSQRAGEMGEKLYRLEQELNETREDLRLRHEADVKASVTHTLQAAIGTPRDGVTAGRDPLIPLVRQAIFHVLDNFHTHSPELEWDFSDDEERVDFADAVVAWLPQLQAKHDASGDVSHTATDLENAVFDAARALWEASQFGLSERLQRAYAAMAADRSTPQPHEGER